MGRESDADREARLARAGEWLKRERKARHLSQDALGRMLGVHQTQISMYEKGRHEIDGELARDLARGFGLSELEVWRGLEMPLPREVMPAEKPDWPETPADIIAWYRANIRDLPPPPETPEEILAWFRRMFPKGIDAGQAPDPHPNRRTANTADIPRQDDDPEDVASQGA